MTSRIFRILLPIGTLCLIAWLLTELSMKVYVFSATQGVVTRNGAPVANAEVERSYKWGWQQKTGSERKMTDAQGRFSFGEVTDWSIAHSILPSTQSVGQLIVVRVEGKEYRVWDSGKDNFKRLGEIGRPINLRCDLTAQDKNRPTHGGIGELVDPGGREESTHD